MVRCGYPITCWLVVPGRSTGGESNAVAHTAALESRITRWIKALLRSAQRRAGQ